MSRFVTLSKNRIRTVQRASDRKPDYCITACHVLSRTHGCNEPSGCPMVISLKDAAAPERVTAR